MFSFYTISFLFKKFLKRSCILEYVVDLSLEWRKVKNIFQSRPCSKVDVKAQLRDEGLFLFLKHFSLFIVFLVSTVVFYSDPK